MKTSPDGLLNSLLSAIETNFVEKLVADGTAAFKKAMTSEILDPISAQLSPRFKIGSKIDYLGRLRQGGFDVFLYRLEFKDGGNDVLARLSLKDSKVAGFLIQ